MIAITKKLNHRLAKNLTLRWLRRMYWSVWIEVYSKHTGDYKFICRGYQKATGRMPCLSTPERYTEKLQWLKLFYRDPLIERCSDKYDMKRYLQEQGYGNLAVETIGIFDNVSDIDLSKLPNRFVLKATHGSGWNLICTDKEKLDWRRWKRLFRIWQKQNPHWFGREWNYKSLKPRIIVEQYLQDDSGELRDYKIFCFNGNPMYMQVDENRLTNHRRKYYDRNGNLLVMQDSHQHSGESKAIFSDKQKHMFELAEVLAKPFPMVRIDCYEQNSNLYIGEFTFFDGSGFFKFVPDEWDFVWGKQFILPEPNFNLELLNSLKGE